MSARTRALVRNGSLVGGLAAASLPVGTAAAQEQPRTGTYLAGGTHITYAFGAEQPWGWGVELRMGGLYEDIARYDCNEDVDAAFYGGGALRFEAFPASHARMVIAAQGGRMFSSVFGAQGEAGFGYRWGREFGFEPVFGAELDVSYAALALHFTPTRAELNPSIGIVAPRMGVSYTRTCVVPGRPQRAADGFAPLPALMTVARGAQAASLQAPPQVTEVWGMRARTEWASVPAFQDLAEQLRVAHAPLLLVSRCYAAAVDEQRHAMLAGSQCAELSGAHVMLERDAPRSRPLLGGIPALVRIALESWQDGCLGEGAAAACANAEAQRAASASLRSSQDVIARDEAAHAELAWDVLAWALEEGGDPVRAALHDAAATTHAPFAGPSNRADEQPGYDDYGILSSQDAAALADEQRTRSLQRLDALLARSA